MKSCVGEAGRLRLGNDVDAKHIMDAYAGREGIVESMLATWRRALAERKFRAELAEMDTRLLVDIGIAEDEVARVRAREWFTPRAWLSRRQRHAGA